MKKLAPIAYLAAIVASGMANAADNGVYFGGSVGKGSSDFGDVGWSRFGVHDAIGWKILSGIRPLDWLGLEVSYVDMGTIKQDFGDWVTIPEMRPLELWPTGYSGHGMAYLDVGPVDLFVKVGVVRWKAEVNGSSSFGSFNLAESGTDLAWGAGAQMRFGRLAARLEFERFEVDEMLASKPELLSVGLTWTFL